MSTQHCSTFVSLQPKGVQSRFRPVDRTDVIVDGIVIIPVSLFDPQLAIGRVVDGKAHLKK